MITIGNTHEMYNDDDEWGYLKKELKNGAQIVEIETNKQEGTIIWLDYTRQEKETIITPEQAAKIMNAIKNDNSEFAYTETRHIDADMLMTLILEQLGYEEVSRIFWEELDKWYA